MESVDVAGLVVVVTDLASGRLSLPHAKPHLAFPEGLHTMLFFEEDSDRRRTWHAQLASILVLVKNDGFTLVGRVEQTGRNFSNELSMERWCCHHHDCKQTPMILDGAYLCIDGQTKGIFPLKYLPPGR